MNISYFRKHAHRLVKGPFSGVTPSYVLNFQYSYATVHHNIKNNYVHDSQASVSGLSISKNLSFSSWRKPIHCDNETSAHCISFHSPILALFSKLTFFPCVVLVVAVCYLGHPKNLLID